MFKKALLYSVMLGLMTSNPVFAQYGQMARPATRAVRTVKMTPRQAMYHYAKSGNINGLQQLKAQGHSIELLDASGQSALCEAVWKKDKTAVSVLIQLGANQNSQCMNQIPYDYKSAVGLQNISSGMAINRTPGIPVATAAETGLSTGAKVAIGVGAVALVGGGIALAAGGGGGGGDGGDSPSEPPEDPPLNLCENVNCGTHGYCVSSTGLCSCRDGYTGAYCQFAPDIPSECPDGTPTGADPSTCECPIGYTEVDDVCVANETPDSTVVTLPSDTTENSTRVAGQTTYTNTITVSSNTSTSNPAEPAIYAYGGNNETENTVAVSGNTGVNSNQGMAILATENTTLTNTGTVTLAPVGYGITATNGAGVTNSGTVTNATAAETDGETVVGMVADGISSNTEEPDTSTLSLYALPPRLVRERARAYNWRWIHFYLRHPASVYYGMRALNGGLAENATDSEIKFEFEPGTRTGLKTRLIAMNADGVYDGELSEDETSTGGYISTATNNGTISMFVKGLQTHDLDMFGMTATRGGSIVNNGTISLTPDNLTAFTDKTRTRTISAIGMFADGKTSDASVVSKAVNNGDIKLSDYLRRYYGYDVIIGMMAKNGAEIVNNGTFTVSSGSFDFTHLMLADGVGSKAINNGTIDRAMYAQNGAEAVNSETGIINLNPISASSGNWLGMSGTDKTEGTHVSLVNDGQIKADLTVNSLGKYYGMYANSNGSTLTNNATIAFTENGGARATTYGMYGNRLTNNGTISLTTGSTAAMGVNQMMYAFGVEDYRGSLINNEGKTVSISGDHIRGSLMDAGDFTDLVNNGTLSYNGKVAGYALHAMSAGEASSIINNGTIVATLDGVLDSASSVFGMVADDKSTAKTALTNNRSIDFDLTNQIGTISGVGMDSVYGALTNATDATISITALKSEAESSGIGGNLIAMESDYGQITNNGTITIESDFINSILAGINKVNSSSTSTPDVKNMGSMTLTSIGSGADVYGIYSKDANIYNEADATISISATGANSYVAGIYDYTGLTNTNNGTITVSSTGGSSSVYGIKSGYSNDGTVTNNATINITAQGNGTDVYGMCGSQATSLNAGSIVINSAASGTVVGAYGNQSETGSITITDNRTVGTRYDSDGIFGLSTGISSSANNLPGTNYGDITINSNMSAGNITGISGSVINYGDVVLNIDRNDTNKGGLHQYAKWSSYRGISSSQAATIKNYGNVTVSAVNTADDYTGAFSYNEGEGLFGIYHSSGSNGVQNFGTITVNKNSLNNEQAAFGVRQASTSFLNGCSAENPEDCGVISVSSKGAGNAYGVLVRSNNYTDTVINNGSISVTKEAGLTSTGAVRGITNIYSSNGGDAFNVVNNGSIVATNNGAAGASGIYLDSTYDEIPSQVINNGTITVNATGGGNAYGIYVKASASSEDDIALKNISNTGTITVNTTNANNTSVEKGAAYGIYASGRDVRVYNTGTIVVNGDSKTGSAAADACDTGTCYYVDSKATGDNSKLLYTYVNGTSQGYSSVKVVADQKGYYTTRTGSGTSADPYVLSGFVSTSKSDDGFNHIFLTDGATFVDGGYTDMNGASVNFANLTNNDEGNYAVTTGFSMDAASVSGSLQVDSSAVQNGNENQYTIENAFKSEDVQDLVLESNSYMFDADLISTSDTTHDIVMTMKSFDDVTSNKSLASFLEANYANGNNEAFFNDLKGAETAVSFNASLDSLTGRDTIAKFTHEDLTAMREVNFAMNELMFANNDKPMFETNGSLNAFNFKNDNNSSAQYALANKRISPRMKIGYAMSTTNLNTDNDDDTTRRNSVFQVFAPISYDRSGWQMIATPQIGFARGHYTRKGYNGTSYEGVIEKRIFALMNEARYPMTVGKFEIAPTVEFNAIAYNTKGSEDEKAYSLTMPSDNSLSVEAGLGIYAKRNVGNMKFNAGLMVYREFADPYNIKMG
ncbi:MAG: hypothetical protein E7013_04785, partial [Alphaproteobacteria bacterium]|nr:hypothetical protein [Alphaproteobacteria bacterium]